MGSETEFLEFGWFWIYTGDMLYKSSMVFGSNSREDSKHKICTCMKVYLCVRRGGGETSENIRRKRVEEGVKNEYERRKIKKTSSISNL